ncbi:phage baseplate assembly protein V [Aquimarina longa]|uniref:phage baseplate assembly protein V n=1 Tax=Aquimarina longa TaxID=1080221 RepID=UPI0007843E26|nr:phage baseplate assembly protein V [Aquimarina longa]
MIVEIFIDGKTEISQDNSWSLMNLTVDRAVEVIPKAYLEFVNEEIFNEDMYDNDLLHLGSTIEVKAGYDNTTSIFKGVITHLRSKNKQNTFFLEVECRDIAYRMSLGKKLRFYHNDLSSNEETVPTMTDDQLFQRLGKIYEIPIKIEALNNDEYQDVVHENLPQYSTTDWDFLVIRAQATGRLVSCENGTIRLVVPQPDEANEVETLSFGGKRPNVIEFNTEMDGRLHANKIAITSWDIDEQKAQIEQDKTIVWERQKNNTVTEIADKTGVTTSNYYHAGDLLKSESKTFGYATMQRNTLSKIRGTFTIFGTNSISPGDWVKIEGLGKNWNGLFFVGGVRHFIKEEWFTTVQIGIDPESHLERYPIQGQSTMDLMPPICGLVYGKVVGYAKSTGGYEMIEVAIFSPDKESSDDTFNTLFARISTIFAGATGSTVFRPDINDEVVLGFIGNDPRFPVVLGSLHNTKTLPEWPLEKGANDQEEQFKKGLHIKKKEKKEESWNLLFDDREEKMEISSTNKFMIQLDDKNDKLTISSTKQNNMIIMDNNGITLKSDKGIRLEKSNGTTINLDKDFVLNADKGNVIIKGKEIAHKAKTSAKTDATTIKFN